MPDQSIPATRRQSGRGPAGFTLVELLVVIGIVAVLIGILLPTLSRARENANRIACGSNMRQWFYACMMYHQDNKTLPGPLVPATLQYDKAIAAANLHGLTATSALLNQTNTGDPGWLYKSTGSPYVFPRYFGPDNVGVYFCPSNRDYFDHGTCVSGTTYAGYNLGMSYLLNNQYDTSMPFFFGYWGTIQATKFNPDGTLKLPNTVCKTLSQVRAAGSLTAQGLGIKNLSLIWMMSDIDGWNFSTNTSTLFGIADGAIPVQQRLPRPPHKSGAYGRNYLYFDGHVQWQPTGTGVPFNAFDDGTGG